MTSGTERPSPASPRTLKSVSAPDAPNHCGDDAQSPAKTNNTPLPGGCAASSNARDQIIKRN